MNEKKHLLRLDELVDHVNELIRLGKGDLGRLTHIKDNLQQNKTLYESDKEYLEKLSKQYLSDKLNVDETHYDQQNSSLFCFKCGQNLKSDNNFCPKCGTPQETHQTESFCGKCGNKVYGNNACSNCNQQYSTKNNNTNPNYMRQRPTEWKSEGTTLILTIILGIFGLGGIGHIYLGNITRGIVILIVGIILLVVSIFTLGIGLIILIPFAIWVVFDARNQCRYYNDYLEQNGKSPW